MKKLFSLTIVLAMLISIVPTAGILTVSAAESDLSIVGTEALYEEFDYSDPMYVSDEDLFGVWDSENEEWTQEPYLNYEFYQRELEEVENAAKAGDYELAKQKVTDYYRIKFSKQPRTITKKGDRSSIIAAKLACYNTYGASDFTNLDIVNIPSSNTDFSADILSVVQAAANDTAIKERTFQIAAVTNDGYTAYIHSRESADAPYALVEVNGVQKEFPVKADAYIRGGDEYQNVNFGTSDTNPENILMVAENTVFPDTIKFPLTRYDYYGVDLSGVARARITIDFTGLEPGDIVTYARLCFTGYSDADDKKQCVVQYKSDIGGKEDDTTWTWKKATRTYANYIGLPGVVGYSGDNSTPYNRNELGNFEQVGLLSGVYRYTNDETYAYHAFRYFNAHINAWGHMANAGSNNQGNLALGTRAADIPVQLFQLSTSKHFTPENFIPILKYAWTCGQGLVKCWNSMSEESNWGTYETAGLSALVVNFKEFSVVDAPIEEGGWGEGKQGGWLELVNHRYYLISGNIIRADGSFDETMGYGKEVINNYLKYPKYAEAAGEQAFLSEPLKENLNILARYLMTVAGPNFTCFQYGDSYAYGSVFATVAKDIGDLTGDPFLVWVGSGGKQGEAPDYTSKLYDVNRKASLKSGWGSHDVHIDFSSDQTLMGHNHPDDLNISMFAYGDPLLTDAKQYSYGTNDPKRLAVYSTNMHNTLAMKVVNPNTGNKENVSHMANISGIYSGPYPVYSQFKPQEEWDMIYYNRARNGEPGVIHRSEINDAYNYVEMSHSNYEDYQHPSADAQFVKTNVNMKRSLLFLKNAKYLIVTDYVKALDDNDYIVTQNWHMLPSSGVTMDEKSGIAETHYPGANVQVIPVNTQSPMDSYIEQEGYYSRTNGVIEHNPFPCYEKSGSGDKIYNTIILPTKSGQEIKSEATALQLDVDEKTASAARITMTDTKLNQTREVNYYFLHDTRKLAQRSFGSYSADAKMALVEKFAGYPSMLILQGGSNILDNAKGKALIKSLEKIEELSVVFDGDTLKLDTTNDIDLEALTIRSEDAVSSVLLNGERVSYTQDNNYIYFGDEPILADDVEDNDSSSDSTGSDDKNENAGNHGTSKPKPSGGGGGGGGGGTSEKDDKTETKDETENKVNTENKEDASEDKENPVSESFKEELSGHWGEKEIKSLIETGIVKGDDGGKLNLKNSVTRAELLTLIVRALKLETDKFDGEFTDVNENDWFADVIATAKKAGLVDGSDGKVMPNEPVTREQMAKFLVLAHSLTENEVNEEGESISFKDSESVSLWAVEFVEKATKLGILNGMGDGTFAPKNAVLREQAFAAIGRLIK